MKDHVAVVTGAGQGIGRCVAARLLEAGMRVVIAERNRRTGREAERELAAKGTVCFVPTDVGHEASVKTVVAKTIATFGRLDLLVNNAATSHGAPLAKLGLAHWNRVLAVNLTGPMLCAKHAAPHLRQAKGSIVNIASTRALMSEANTEAYSATKGGVVALTHALAVSLGPDVRVNCVSPGWIATAEWLPLDRRSKPDLKPADHAQHPCGRVGTPDDIAAMVLYLASPAAGFITGQNFVVDGGMTRKMIYVE
jgi:NAD(P)-dependent dehydrogenase (short-subunit alcohol dehydrogenase family)